MTERRLLIRQYIDKLTKVDVEATLNQWSQSDMVDDFLKRNEVFKAFKYVIVAPTGIFDAKAALVISLRNTFPVLSDLSVRDIPGTKASVAEPLRQLGFSVVDKNELTPTVSIREGIKGVLEDYGVATNQNFKQNPIANLVRDSLPGAVKHVIGSRLKVTGSPGKGRWAETPWVAIFDPQARVILDVF